MSEMHDVNHNSTQVCTPASLQATHEPSAKLQPSNKPAGSKQQQTPTLFLHAALPSSA
jgi:hypothetical protein